MSQRRRRAPLPLLLAPGDLNGAVRYGVDQSPPGRLPGCRAPGILTSQLRRDLVERFFALVAEFEAFAFHRPGSRLGIGYAEVN